MFNAPYSSLPQLKWLEHSSHIQPIVLAPCLNPLNQRPNHTCAHAPSTQLHVLMSLPHAPSPLLRTPSSKPHPTSSQPHRAGPTTRRGSNLRYPTPVIPVPCSVVVAIALGKKTKRNFTEEGKMAFLEEEEMSLFLFRYLSTFFCRWVAFSPALSSALFRLKI